MSFSFSGLLLSQKRVFRQLVRTKLSLSRLKLCPAGLVLCTTSGLQRLSSVGKSALMAAFPQTLRFPGKTLGRGQSHCPGPRDERPHCRRVLGSQAPRTGSQQAGWPPSGFGRPHLPPKAVTGRRTCVLGTERPLPFWGGPLPAVCEPGGCLPGWKQPHRYTTRVTLSLAFANGVPARACCPNRIANSGPFSLSEASQHHIRHLACYP